MEKLYFLDYELFADFLSQFLHSYLEVTVKDRTNEKSIYISKFFFDGIDFSCSGSDCYLYRPSKTAR
ncbi:hypothetical protein XNA1_3260003 [Xenorhabdus nematophila str. Anatoliense]|nr:hypothetical protein XNA1_3260003 [Xenorhabdus nematophila str. Anatoliense]